MKGKNEKPSPFTNKVKELFFLHLYFCTAQVLSASCLDIPEMNCAASHSNKKNRFWFSLLSLTSLNMQIRNRFEVFHSSGSELSNFPRLGFNIYGRINMLPRVASSM